MALRSLLRRIPVLQSPTGPRLGPVHGISPAATSRFMCTRSEGAPRAAAELHKDPENLDKLRKSTIEKKNKLREELVEIKKDARLRVAEYARAVDDLRKLGDVATVVFSAIPLLLILGSKYQA